LPLQKTTRPLRDFVRRHCYPFIAQAFLILPALHILITGGPRGPGGSRGAFAYLSGDALYYFVVARNIVERGIVSFDQFHPTNGFHPLWQVIAALLYWPYALTGWSSGAYLVIVVVASVAILSAALCLVYWALHRAYGRVGILFLLFPTGIYGMVGYYFLPSPFGALPAFANGMESSVLLLSYAAFLLAITQYLRAPTMMGAIAIGLTLGAVSLSRLDHTLLAVAAVPAMALCALHKPERWAIVRHAVIAGAIVAAMLGLYLLWSRLYVGSWLPVSGVIKAESPGAVCLLNLTDFRQSFAAAFVDVDRRLQDPFLWRGLQLLVPLGVAIVYGLIITAHAAYRRSLPPPLSTALVITAVMSMGLSCYNLAAVPLMKQGDWYVPVSILFVTLALYDLATRFVPARIRDFRPGGYALVIVLLYANWNAASTLANVRNEHLHQNVYREAALVARHYEGQDIRLLSYVDGIYAYGTRFPVMSGLLFTVDPEALRLFREEGLSVLEIAYDRGFRYIPVVSPTPSAFRLDMTRQEVEDALKHKTGIFTASFPGPWRPLPFDFAVDLIGDEHFTVIKMIPREEDD